MSKYGILNGSVEGYEEVLQQIERYDRVPVTILDGWLAPFGKTRGDVTRDLATYQRTRQGDVPRDRNARGICLR